MRRNRRGGRRRRNKSHIERSGFADRYTHSLRRRCPRDRVKMSRRSGIVACQESTRTGRRYKKHRRYRGHIRSRAYRRASGWCEFRKKPRFRLGKAARSRSSSERSYRRKLSYRPHLDPTVHRSCGIWRPLSYSQCGRSHHLFGRRQNERRRGGRKF